MNEPHPIQSPCMCMPLHPECMNRHHHHSAITSATRCLCFVEIRRNSWNKNQERKSIFQQHLTLWEKKLLYGKRRKPLVRSLDSCSAYRGLLWISCCWCLGIILNDGGVSDLFGSGWHILSWSFEASMEGPLGGRRCVMMSCTKLHRGTYLCIFASLYHIFIFLPWSQSRGTLAHYHWNFLFLPFFHWSFLSWNLEVNIIGNSSCN